MGCRKILSILVAMVLLAFSLSSQSMKKAEKKDYISFQFYFEDFYGSWSPYNFLRYNENSEEFYWDYYNQGFCSGNLHLSAGFCWKHFFKNKVFTELAITTGIYSFEKVKIYDNSRTLIDKFRPPPMEYIIQFGIGYVVYKTRPIDFYIQAACALSSHRANPDNIKIVSYSKEPFLVWRGEFGAIFRISEKFFLEGSVGYFLNSNLYHYNGHQGRIGFGLIL